MKDAAVNLGNTDGWTPVHLAAHLNNFDSLNLLIENGGSLLRKNQSGMTPLEVLVSNDHRDLL